ncbi:MAG: hypothetical protein AAF229_08265 [Pseudomonadota bacterium]
MNKTMNKRAGLTAICLAIMGCGGGGGGGDTSQPPPPPVTRYTIGGTVGGLSGDGLVLQNNGGDNLSVSADGGFTFSSTVASGSSYNVTVSTQPSNPAQDCSVANGSGTATANVTNVSITCTTPTASIDTDGDGLTDAQEAAIGTSPDLADTDGDGLTDFEEQNQGGFNPLVADLPTVTIEVVTDPSIEINVTDEDGVSNAQSFNSTFETGQETSYSRSDTEATSATLEASTRVYSEASVSATPTSIGGSAKSGTESSVSASVTQERSTSITSNSASSARQEYGQLTENASTNNRRTNGGSLRTRIRVTNTSNLTFSLESLRIGASRRTASGSIQTLGELVLENPNPDPEVANGGSIEADVERMFSNANDLERLMQDPSGLLFTVSNFFMTDIGTVEGRSWGEVSQDVAAQTAQVVIDFGANNTVLNGGRTVESYQVATNVPRDANGTVIGESMGVLLGDSLGIPYTTIVKDIVDDNGNPTGESRRIVNSVRGVETQSIADGFWYVFTSSESADNPLTDFDDLIMQPRDRISIVYLRDQDGDELFDREEFLLGTSPIETDSDSDGLSDFVEAREGWSVSVDGEARMVFSNPLDTDSDGDGWDDLVERGAGTDPNNADTDGDGLADNDDPNPTGPDRVTFVTTFEGPTLLLDADVTVIASGSERTVTGLRIDWGDGTPIFAAPDCNPDCSASLSVATLHQYAAEGDYTLTVTADVDGSSSESRSYQVGVTPMFAADLGLSANSGFDESRDTRLIADINGDGRDDIVAFGQGGTYTALSNGTGFDPAVLQFENFASGASYNKTQRRRELANVAGNAALDIVEFADDGVRIAVNDGAGNFSVLCPDAPCTADYGVAQGYADFPTFPRYLSDVDRDGRDDIVAFSNNGVKIGRATGSGFVDANPGGFAIEDYGRDRGGWLAANPRILLDVNGDGLDDIAGFGGSVLVVAINDGNYRFGDKQNYSSIMTANAGYRIDRHIRTAVDIDADGFDDLVAYANSGVFIKRADGEGELQRGPLSGVSPQFGFNDGWRLDRDARFQSDVNGDGLPDLVGFGPGIGGGVIYAINTGDGRAFEGARLWVADYGSTQGYDNTINPRFMGDVDGDGRSDLVAFGNSAVFVTFALSAE